MDNVRKYISLFILCILAIASCTHEKYLTPREKEFGTEGKNSWSFHQLSDQDKGISLAFPGYVFSFEKAMRSNIGAPLKKDLRTDSLVDKFKYNSKNTWKKISGQKREILNDPKPMFLSGIYEFSIKEGLLPFIKQEAIYNAYDTTKLENAKNAYDQGFEEIEEVSSKIINRIEREEFTHLIFMCMGWNSDHQESIRNFNSIFTKIVEISEPSFKPLFVGLTWPSKWSRKWYNAFSFFNKTNDADELGMTWANYLLNENLLNSRHDADFKTIVIGHSFGAKLTSKMVMSKSMLAAKSKKVDLLINLQGAYSVNRFTDCGIEKAEDYKQWREHVDQIVLTSSKHDKAVNYGFYAPFAGKHHTYKKVKKHRVRYSEFEPFKVEDMRKLTLKQSKKILFLDASSIIKQSAYNKGGKAHSDIYNDEVAEMIYSFISSIE